MSTRQTRLARLLAAAQACERERIAKAQRGALRNLRSLLGDTQCALDCGLWGCGTRRGTHVDDCGYGQLREDIRTLAAATREPRR